MTSANAGSKRKPLGKLLRNVLLLIAGVVSVLSWSTLATAAGTSSADAGGVAPNASAAATGVTLGMEKVTPLEFRGDVRTLPQYPMGATAQPKPYRPLLEPPRSGKSQLRPIVQEKESINIPLAPMPISTSFPGMSHSDICTGGQCGGGWPPDPNGDVGPNHYIQAVNVAYAIYNKAGALLSSFTEDSLWSAGGTNPCNGNSSGDPIVLYDPLADRWILTHFAFTVDGSGNLVSPFYQCIAVSKSGDPVNGGWWLYPLRMDPGGTGAPPVGTFNDYAKFGIWPDCLYMTANGFTEPGDAYAGITYASFSRSDMYSGASLTWSLGFLPVSTTSTPPLNPSAFTLIPSNILGSGSASLPPAGTPNYFVNESNTAFEFEVRKFTAGPNCGAGGTLGAPATVSQTGYTFPGNTDLVPQPGTTNVLDSLIDRLMQKVQYRRIGSAESLWIVHTVQDTTTSLACPQWAQLDVTGGAVAAAPVQQQIYCPDSSLYRWMGSLAVDRAGNMALGYSTSNGTAPNYPGIAYSGRLATDPLNTLPQTETQMTAGAASQTNNCGGAPCHRWGDYSAMSVDPADDCTFWYTNEYYSSAANGSSGNWQTQIGHFKFPSCTPATLPSVTTATVTGITATTASGGGTVTADGGTAVTARGVCWSTVSNPTIADPHTSDGSGLGVFTSSITGLKPVTPYHVRAYAVNGAGVAYGNDTTFSTSGNPQLSVTIATTGGTGAGGRVTSTPAGIDCTTGTCSANFTNGTPITLAAAPNSSSILDSWSGACSGSGSCGFTISADTNVTATFSLKPARITTSSYFNTISAAYAALPAPTGGTIQARQFTFVENPNLNVAIPVTLTGGFDPAYSANTGYTTIQGNLTVTLGSLTADRIIIR